MVIPWVGYSLSKLINHVQPWVLQNLFLLQRLQMRNDASSRISKAGSSMALYEGLRMDEAMNPLTLLTFGFYGKKLLEQNGAPVRLVIPWKYGFKGAKSIVR